MPRRITNIRWQRVLTDRTRGGGESFQGFAGVCNLGNGQMGAIFGEHIEQVFNGVFFSLAPAKWKHRFYISDDGGFNWRLASEIPTDGSDGLNFAIALFKSGMIGSRPGGAFHGQSGGATNVGSIIFNRPGGIYRMRQNDGKWVRVLNPGSVGGSSDSPAAIDFHIFCDFANPGGFGNDRVLFASGEFDSTVVIGPGPIFDFGSIFYFVRSTDSGREGSWLRFGPGEPQSPGGFPQAIETGFLDGIVAMLFMRDTNTWLVGAHMSAASPRAWWSTSLKPGTLHEIHFPGNFDQFVTEQYCETFINFGNGIIVAGGGAPTGKFPVSNSTFPNGIPFSQYRAMHGFTQPAIDNGYWHYPILWRTTTGAGGTWQERSLSIGQFAARTAIPGGQPGAVGDADGEWRTRCGVHLGDGTGCIGLYVNPFGYTTSESPFWITNDYGESFPFPGEFQTEPYTWFVPQQMTVTNDGNILVGAYVERPSDPSGNFLVAGDPAPNPGQLFTTPTLSPKQGELWLGIVEATEYMSVGFMERPAVESSASGTGLRPDSETTRG